MTTLIIHAKVQKETEPPETFSIHEDVECKECEGDGIVVCEECNGTGHVTCDGCLGSGKVEREIEVTSEEMEARESVRRQEALLRKRYGTERPSSIRYLFFPELEDK